MTKFSGTRRKTVKHQSTTGWTVISAMFTGARLKFGPVAL
jgi:hypothetical protein